MIVKSASLQKQLVRETLRYTGSMSVIVHYKGLMPKNCESKADGDRIGTTNPTESVLRMMAAGHSEPPMMTGANYWRLLDNGGNVVMQGDGR